MVPELSVIIPAYNEEKRLPLTLEAVLAYLTALGEPFEVLIVDDGSKDGTAQVVENFAKVRSEVRLVSYQLNRGKGHAVRTGILAARGKLLLIDDADGSSPIEEVARLRTAIEN